MSYQIQDGKVISNGSEVITGLGSESIPGFGYAREYRWSAVDDKIVRLYVVIPHFSDPFGKNGKEGYPKLLPRGARFDFVADIILSRNNLV
jgi:hypothetical protein